MTSPGPNCVSPPASKRTTPSGILLPRVRPSRSSRLASQRVCTRRADGDGRDADGPAPFPSRKPDRLTGRASTTSWCGSQSAPTTAPTTLSVAVTRGGVTPHALRHPVVDRLLRVEAGNTLSDGRSRLRHSSLLTTGRSYDHLFAIRARTSSATSMSSERVRPI